MPETAIVTHGERDTAAESAEEGHAGHKAGETPVETIEEAVVPQGTCTRSCISKSAVLVLIVTLIGLVIIDSFTTMSLMVWFEQFLTWLRGNVALGSLAFAAVYVVGTVIFFPALLLTLGAGFTFSSALGQGPGIAVATLVVFVGASIGAMIAFLLGRYVLRDTAKKWAKRYKVLGALDAAIGKSGFRFVALLRLSPVVPFAAFNYVASITSVKFRDYAMALIAIIPGTAAYCYFGSLLTSVRETAAGEVADPALQWTLIVVGVIATIGALALVTFYARREVTAALAANAEDEAGEAEEEEDAAGADPAQTENAAENAAGVKPAATAA